MKWFSLSILLLLLVSCNSYSDTELEEYDQTIQEYIKTKGLDMEKTDDGMYYHIIDEGEGDQFIQYNDEVTFYYKGSFIDGNTFQSVDESKPLSYEVNSLIMGWQDALLMLKNGGKIKIILPPQLAYGSKMTGLIPENSILIYELGVLDVQ